MRALTSRKAPMLVREMPEMRAITTQVTGTLHSGPVRLPP